MGGIASPTFKTGRYSKYLPARLIDKYQEARDDPALAELRDEIALTDSRLSDILQRVDTGESGTLWANVQKALDEFLKEYPGGVNVGPALLDLRQAIKAGQDDWLAWREISVMVEQRRKLVETEGKRLQAMQQMITTERAMTLIAAITDVIRQVVTDRQQLAAISAGIMGLLNAGKPAEVIDVEAQ